MHNGGALVGDRTPLRPLVGRLTSTTSEEARPYKTGPGKHSQRMQHEQCAVCSAPAIASRARGFFALSRAQHVVVSQRFSSFSVAAALLGAASLQFAFSLRS